MAYMVARTEKRKIGSLVGYQNHVDRKTKNHSNKDIDESKTHLNYDLVGHKKSTSFHHEFMNYIENNRVGSRAVRKDAVVLQDWLISSSQDFFENLNEKETRLYFETAVEFFAEKFGRENIRFATVHLDEKTPHMHMGIVPLREGKLTAKTIFDRSCLRMVQNELPQTFQNAGFNIKRGEEKSEKVHVNAEEYKATLREAQAEFYQIVGEAQLEAEISRMKFTEKFYDIWEKDWDKTEQEFPDFKFNERSETVTEITGELDLFDKHNLKPNPRNYPRANDLTFEKVFSLLQEKFEQVREYIALKARKIANKASEAESVMELLERREGLLESKLEAFEREVENFEHIKYNFDAFLDELNPVSQFNKDISDSDKALDLFDLPKKEVVAIKKEIELSYVSDDGVMQTEKDIQEIFEEYLQDLIEPKLIDLGFYKTDPQEKKVAWTKEEILDYKENQVRERSKLKFDVSEIKENIAEHKNDLRQSRGVRM